MKSKSYIRKHVIICTHISLVKAGKYEVARLLLHLLRKGKVKLGLDDASYEAENILEKVGCPCSYGRNYNTVTFRI